MNASLLRTDFIELLDRHSKDKQGGDLVMPDVRLYRSLTCGSRMPGLYNPSICVIAQGEKQILIHEKVISYSAGEYLLASVDIPVIGQVVQASESIPYLCMQIDFNPQELGDVVLQVGECKKKNTGKLQGIVTGTPDYALEDCFVRLLRLLDTPDYIPVLAPMIKKEIYYRLLKSEHAEYIVQMILQGSNLSKIATAIQIIKSHLFHTLNIENLARQVGMSLSSFHAHFKSVTNMSPLQFQKNLQLMEARQLMLVQSMDVSSTAHRVGYQSASQFNREYSRFFGKSPRRDIEALKSRIIGDVLI